MAQDANCLLLPFLFFVFTLDISALLLQVVSPHSLIIACGRLVYVTANPHRFCVLVLCPEKFHCGP